MWVPVNIQYNSIGRLVEKLMSSPSSNFSCVLIHSSYHLFYNVLYHKLCSKFWVISKLLFGRDYLRISKWTAYTLDSLSLVGRPFSPPSRMMHPNWLAQNHTYWWHSFAKHFKYFQDTVKHIDTLLFIQDKTTA